MGRGSAYQYEHFMLVDDTEFDEVESEFFLEDVMGILELKDYGHQTGHRDTSHIGELKDEVIYFNMDYSGGLPCIFAEYAYQDNKEEYIEDYLDSEEEEYTEYCDRMGGIIATCFNKLIDSFPDGTFRYPTSAWTSSSYTKENRY